MKNILFIITTLIYSIFGVDINSMHTPKDSSYTTVLSDNNQEEIHETQQEPETPQPPRHNHRQKHIKMAIIAGSATLATTTVTAVIKLWRDMLQ